MSMTVSGRTILVTGATDGIGLQSAVELARLGARLHLVGRNPAKLEAAAARVAAAGTGAQPVTYVADLSSQASIRQLAGEVTANAPILDVLLNNAGGIFPRRVLSADGIEMTFALNHLGYFLLTSLLLPCLRGAPEARIVNVASAAHAGAVLDFEDLQLERSYSAWKAYGRSKLANIYFTRELARRVQGEGMTANCLHPGFVASNFAGEAKGLFGWAIGAAKRVAAISVANGAKTPVFLCAAPDVEGITGKYFDRCRSVASSKVSHDDVAASRLWSVSERLTGIAP